MYRNIDFPNTSSDHSQWIATINNLSRSRGLQYTHTINLGQFKFIDLDRHGHQTKLDETIQYGHMMALEALIKSLPVDTLTSVEFGSHARPAVEGGYDLLWRSQKNLQNLEVNFRTLYANGQISSLTKELQSLHKLSELKVDFGNHFIHVRLWLRDVMEGHEFRKVHFRRLPSVPKSQAIEINICSLQDCLINGNPGILTHLTIYQVELTDGNRLSLDEFPSLDHLEIDYCFAVDLALVAFRKPRLTHFLLRDNHRYARRMAVLTEFMTRFQTLQSIVLDLTEPFLQLGEGDRFAQAVVQHASGLELLYFTDNGNGVNMSSYGFNDNRLACNLTLLLEPVTKCKQLRQLTIMLRAKDIVDSCKVSSAPNLRSLRTRAKSAH